MWHDYTTHKYRERKKSNYSIVTSHNYHDQMVVEGIIIPNGLQEPSFSLIGIWWGLSDSEGTRQ